MEEKNSTPVFSRKKIATNSFFLIITFNIINFVDYIFIWTIY